MSVAGDGRVRLPPRGADGPLVLLAPGARPLAWRRSGRTGGDPPPILRLAPGHVLVGRLVARDALSLRGARLRLVPDAATVPEAFAVAAGAACWVDLQPAPDGAFRFEHLAAEPHRLLVDLPGAAETCVAAGLVPGDPEPVQVRLPPHLEVRESTLAVTLVDQEGEVVEAPYVELRSADGACGRALGKDAVARVTLRGRGPFVVVASHEAAPGGPARGGAAACLHGVSEGAQAIVLQLPTPVPTRPLSLEMATTDEPGLFVQVVDRTRGTASGPLWLSAAGLRVPTFEDARLDVVWCRSSASRRASVGGVLHGAAAGASLALPPPPPGPQAVRGRVLRADGSAVAGACVTARGAHDLPGSSLTLRCTTDQDGCFEIRAVEGEVLLWAVAPGLHNLCDPVRAGPGEEIRVVVEEERLD